MRVNDSLQTAQRKTLTGLVLLAFFVALSGPRQVQAEPPQAGAAKKPVPPAAKTTAKPPAKPAPKAKVVTTAKTATTGAAAKQPKEKKAAKPSTAKKKKAAGGGAPPVPTSARGTAGAGLRDPFRIPPVGGRGGEVVESEEVIKGSLPPGTRGLVIGQLRLEGTVRLDTSNTMIAVVTNFTNRAYFLRENDTVYNGVVSKIMPDSIVFRQNYLDPNGRVLTREVVRRLGPGAGEGR